MELKQNGWNITVDIYKCTDLNFTKIQPLSPVIGDVSPVSTDSGDGLSLKMFHQDSTG